LLLKKFRSVSNENIDQFFRVKKIRYTFNENKNQFYVLKKHICI